MNISSDHRRGTSRGLLMREGTLVNATIIAAPPSTKNKDHARDPEMHQAKKGNQWHSGMKAHIDVDAESSLVHSVHATAANDSDVAHTHELLHGQEERVHVDAGYAGVDNRARATESAPAAGLDSDRGRGRSRGDRGIRLRRGPTWPAG